MQMVIWRRWRGDLAANSTTDSVITRAMSRGDMPIWPVNHMHTLHQHVISRNKSRYLLHRQTITESLNIIVDNVPLLLNLALASDSLRKGNNVPFLRSPVVHKTNETRSVLWVDTEDKWRLGVVASVVRRMNEVTVHWARLVLGWVTVYGRVYHHSV